MTETAPGGPAQSTAQTEDGCARGCTILNQHHGGCTCTAECADHDNHCQGCIPTARYLGKLCERCANATAASLAQIPDLATLAASRTDGQLSPVRNGDLNFNRKGTSPILSPSPAWDLAEETIQWAWKWAEMVADMLGQWGPLRFTTVGLPARNLTETTTYLSNNLAWLLTEEPETFYAEAEKTRRTLERMTGSDRGIRRIKLRCPSCDQRSLTREDGIEVVECHNADCRRIWRDGEFDYGAAVAAS